jgi:uncharacterized protein
VIHPQTQLALPDPKRGICVVARARIARGTLIWVRDRFDRTLSGEEVAALPPLYSSIPERFAYRHHDDEYILLWDDTRFMNHSCDYNCVPTRFDFEIAVRDIEPGEPLCNDYAMLGMEPGTGFDCHCGSPQCRGWISDVATPELAIQAARQIAHALERVDRVPQPLLGLLPADAIVAARQYYGESR